LHGYWPVRGLGQISRLLLAYSGLKWRDVIYTSGEQWAKDKTELGLRFPNLPYLIDGEFKITET
jgi:glutathione S-transferase